MSRELACDMFSRAQRRSSAPARTPEALLCRQRRKMSNSRSEPKIYATLDSLCSKVGMLLA